MYKYPFAKTYIPTFSLATGLANNILVSLTEYTQSGKKQRSAMEMCFKSILNMGMDINACPICLHAA